MYVNKKAQQSERMRAHLIGQARGLFETKGFDGVSAAEIAEVAGVTRGAVYHHFDGKEGLFSAVAESAMQHMHEQIAVEAAGKGQAREMLIASIKAFLVLASDEKTRQLLFVDAPAVMGWAQWRACDEQYGLGALIALIAKGVEDGSFTTQQPAVSAHLLLSAMIEGAMLIARNPEDQRIAIAVETSLTEWIAAL